MKRRTALIVALTALLAAGVSIFGMRHYNQKEKEEAEKKLNELMVKDAERKLDSLYQDHEKTLAVYEEALKVLEFEQDSIEGLYTLVWEQNKINEIESIVSKLFEQSLGKETWLPDGSKLRVPGEFRRYEPDLTLSNNLRAEMGYQGYSVISDQWRLEDLKTDDLNHFLYLVKKFSIPSMTQDVMSDEGTLMCKKGTEAYDIVDGLDEFLKYADQYQGIFNQATLQKLKQVASELREGLDQQISVESRRYKAQEKLNKYENASSKIIGEQRDELQQLKQQQNKYRNM